MNQAYEKLLANFRQVRIAKFSNMKGYVFGYVVNFDNDKGTGFVVDEEGHKYFLHYKNMDRVNYKVLSKDQKIHFKPGKFKESPVATDVALVY